MSSRRPHIVVLYQYQFPDDVISARLYDDLCEGLARRGWDVEARPSNRSCHDPTASYPLREERNGVTLRRVWRPPLAQAASAGRVLNATWLASAWLADLATRRRSPDVVLVGTDPTLALTIAAPLRRLRPRVKIAHWVFDVYPEAAVAEGLFGPSYRATALLERAMRLAYRACDLIADIGPCMRERLARYDDAARHVTLPPWALVEPPAPPPADATTRRELFGAHATLGLLHSGSFGRAHDPDLLLALARRLRGTGVRMCFAGRGHRIDALRAGLTAQDDAVSVAGFCPEDQLHRRLTAADVHLVSLKAAWSGLVVPSKFFGALAVGRPVVYAGPQDSDLGRWIAEHQVGWVLTSTTLPAVAAELGALGADAARRATLQERCLVVYREHFARERTIERWHAELARLVDPAQLVASR